MREKRRGISFETVAGMRRGYRRNTLKGTPHGTDMTLMYGVRESEGG